LIAHRVQGQFTPFVIILENFSSLRKKHQAFLHSFEVIAFIFEWEVNQMFFAEDL